MSGSGSGSCPTKDTVSSEVHNFSKEEVLDALKGAVLSTFHFTYPSYLNKDGDSDTITPVIDSDGDLDVVRENNVGKKEGIIYIEHQKSTVIDLVGEQVWRGALFLADFILDNPELFCNTSILELASGVGFTSVVAAMVAKQVITTDINRGDILHLIEENIKRNKDVIKSQVSIKELDFANHATIDKLSQDMENVSIIIAADVVYFNQLTDAFFRTVLYLLSKPPDKTMYVALEKRYVFTMNDLDTCAPCYDYFLKGLEWLKHQNEDISWSIEELTNTIPQYFTYERTRHLVLWKIKAMLK